MNYRGSSGNLRSVHYVGLLGGKRVTLLTESFLLGAVPRDVRWVLLPMHTGRRQESLLKKPLVLDPDLFPHGT